MILRVHCVVIIMGIVATQCKSLSSLMHLLKKKCVSMLGITRTDENCCHTMRIMGREMNTLFFFPKNELLPCLMHLGYDMVISLFVWLWLVVNDRKFSAGTVFFSHTTQPAVLLHESATKRTSQPNRLIIHTLISLGQGH